MINGPLPRLPTPIEMHIVALIARGDTYDNIRADVLARFQRGISAGVITTVKKRNSEAIGSIKQAVMEKERDDAEGLLARTHRLMGRKLRQVEEGENSIKDSDLIAISKEMFHQSRIEKGLGDDPAKLANPKEKLKELQELLEENDEIRLERIIFAKRDSSEPAHTEVDSDRVSDRGHEPGILLQGGSPHPGHKPDRPEAQTETPEEESP